MLPDDFVLTGADVRAYMINTNMLNNVYRHERKAFCEMLNADFASCVSEASINEVRR